MIHKMRIDSIKENNFTDVDDLETKVRQNFNDVLKQYREIELKFNSKL